MKTDARADFEGAVIEAHVRLMVNMRIDAMVLAYPEQMKRYISGPKESAGSESEELNDA